MITNYPDPCASILKATNQMSPLLQMLTARRITKEVYEFDAADQDGQVMMVIVVMVMVVVVVMVVAMVMIMVMVVVVMMLMLMVILH